MSKPSNMTTVQLRSRIVEKVHAETNTGKLELILKWLETPAHRSNAMVRSVLIAEMEHLDGKGYTVEEARAKMRKALRH